MRKLARRLLAFGSAASLLLCVASLALWVRSYAVCDELALGWVETPPTSGVLVSAYANCGVVTAGWLHCKPVGPVPPDFDVEDNVRLVPPQMWTTDEPFRWDVASFPHVWGFARKDSVKLSLTLPTPVNEHYRGVCFPLWLPLVLTAVAPGLQLRAIRRRRRRVREVRCAGCGYDLRATPGRCPECGVASGCAGG
jgi:hypothetical protein